MSPELSLVYAVLSAPSQSHVVSALPAAVTGKRLEAPVKRTLQGMPLEAAVAIGSVTDPDALHELARQPVGLREGT